MNIPIKPRIKSCFTIQRIEPDLLFLLSEHRPYILQGKAFFLIAPYLDGKHTTHEIMGKVQDRVSFQDVIYALNHLIQKGCIADYDGQLLTCNSAFWDYFDNTCSAVADSIEKTSITVKALGDIDTQPLVENLGRCGLKVSENGSLLVVVVEDYLMSELNDINSSCLKEGRPWLIVKPSGVIIWIGPFFRPGKTGCWRCLEQRLRANRQVENYISNRTKETVIFRRSRAGLQASTAAGMNLAATELARILASKEECGLENMVITMDTTCIEYRKHILVRRPQCPACGSIKPLRQEPITLKPHNKVFLPGSGHRTVTPEETFERYKHHISPITGVVTSLKLQESDNCGKYYNYITGHYFPVIRDDISLLRANMIARSGGKGRSEINAKTSALCEALERYSGIYWGEEEITASPCNDLCPDAVPVRDLTLFSDEQYRMREQLNLHRLSDQEYIPEPLDDHARIAWTRAYSLTHGCFKYLPAAYCYYGFKDPEHFFCVADSNGNAAGNTIEEAILQGFLELVERDSVALWWYNRVKRPQVDADSFGMPYFTRIKRLYTESLDRDLHVLDITADLKIPAFVAVSRRLNHEAEDIIIGFGAHLDPKTAMLRALEEITQYLPALEKTDGNGDTIYRFSHPKTIQWWKDATYQNQPYLVPDAKASMKTLSDFTSMASNDIMEDVSTCVSLALKRNLEVLVVDQTRPDIGLPVAKVVVPGLRHFWRRLGPGRLYETPVELGWLESPRKEGEMNPVSCFV